MYFAPAYLHLTPLKNAMSETQRQLLADILDAKEGESLASSSAALAEQREEEHDGITLSFEEQINAFVDGDIPPEETAAAKDRPCIECEGLP